MKKQHSLDTFAVYPQVFALLLLLTLLFAGYRSCDSSCTIYPSSRGSAQWSPKAPLGGDAGSGGIATLALKQSPKYVRKLISYLQRVKHFNPPKGFKGGRVFKNWEGKLPKGKTYYEYDVLPQVNGVPRGAERLIIDQEKRVFYYTKDHYNSFIKIE